MRQHMNKGAISISHISSLDHSKPFDILGTILGNTLSWSVKKQVTFAKPTTEAEYRSLSSATTYVLWLRRLIAELKIPQSTPTVFYYDNTSAIVLANNLVFHTRTKYIKIDFHFIRKHMNKGAISISHISSLDQLTDIQTKPLPAVILNDLCSKLIIQPMNDHFEVAC